MFCKYCGSALADQNESCSNCGSFSGAGADFQHSVRLNSHRAAVEAARSTDRRARFGIVTVIGIGLVVLCVAIALIPDSEVSRPAPIVKGPNYNETPKTTVEAQAPQARMPVAAAPDPASLAAAAHQQRLAALRQKQEAAGLAIEIEREAINKTLKRDGIEGVPEDEHDYVNRLIQEKESIDAAIKEEEQK